MSEKEQDYTIGSESQYQEVLTHLSRQDRPNVILRKLMNAFESYRQARKLGWSRPWNKYDLNNFQSFKLNPSDDRGLIDSGRTLLAESFPTLPAEALAFVDELLADPELMGFIFVHEYRADGRLFEGATLSLGRKRERRYRDRFDLILESEVTDGDSRGLSRIRLYIDPYVAGVREPLYTAVAEPPAGAEAQSLFARLSEISWEWEGLGDKVWDHWTSAYIDYFGPRQFILRESFFHLPNNPAGRMRAA